MKNLLQNVHINQTVKQTVFISPVGENKIEQQTDKRLVLDYELDFYPSGYNRI